MKNSIVLHRVTSASKTFSSLSCGRFGSKCRMENLGVTKKYNLKLHSEKMNTGKVQVYVTEPITSVPVKETEVSHGLGIVRFMEGKVFLITGATGFLAKVLIEKILRAAPDVGKIYILMKARDKEAATQRMKAEIINTELFQGLELTYGKSQKEFIISKLVPVVGDLCTLNLGMELGLANEIADEVDIIINSGGNTSFDERFDVSLCTNTLGPSRFLGFAKRCKKLKLFLHVSTAYVNGERKGIIMEKPFNQGECIAGEKASLECSLGYFPVLDVEDEINKALDARNALEDKTVSQKMKEMGLDRAKSYGWQDTYAFTKAMGEMMIDDQRDEIPIVIIRPSVIESTLKEPIKGWIEGIRMLDPMLVYYAKGVLTGFPVNANAVIDIVPADMVVNAILAATVKHGTMRKPGLNVYHVGSSVSNPLLLRDFFGYFYEYFHTSPFMDVKRGPVKVQKMKLFQTVEEFHSHIEAEAVPKRLEDTNGRGPSRRIRKSLDIAKHLAKIYEPYMFYQGLFDSSNTEQLFDEMSHEEKSRFGFDVKSINWKDYICNIHIPGVLTHSLKGRGT